MSHHAATKILAFPVKGRKWAFLAKPPILLSDTDAQVPKSVVALWSSLKLVKAPSAKFELVTDYAAGQMYAQWMRCQEAPQKSIRGRIFQWGSVLLARLQPREIFLKELPKDIQGIELIFPASLNPRLVRRRVRHLAVSGEVRHQKLFYGSISLLPFTVMLGILPTPNLPFFWNLYRAHANWTALRGSVQLKSMVTEPPPKNADALSNIEVNEAPPSGKRVGRGRQIIGNERAPIVGRNRLGSPRLIFSPSKDLEIMTRTGAEVAISDDAISAICEKYCVNPVLIKQWRDRS